MQHSAPSAAHHSVTPYALISPVRDEIAHLPQLADAILASRPRPSLWVIVDNGSTDGTLAFAQALAQQHDWITVRAMPPAGPLARGAASVRAFTAGLDLLRPEHEIVVQLDADVWFDAAYFREVVSQFDAHPTLGIASGRCLEPHPRGGWRFRHVTGDSVWGATRAYRRACLNDVLPLEERIGWDGIDQMKAQARGWETRTIPHVAFRHLRPEGSRDGRSRFTPWLARGHASYYMGYRPWYLVLRALRHALHDPHALAILWAFAQDTWTGAPACTDPVVTAHLRNGQRLSQVPARVRQTFGIQ